MISERCNVISEGTTVLWIVLDYASIERTNRVEDQGRSSNQIVVHGL